MYVESEAGNGSGAGIFKEIIALSGRMSIVRWPAFHGQNPYSRGISRPITPLMPGFDSAMN
jgi:hypothetical protein